MSVMQQTGSDNWQLMMLVNRDWCRATHADPAYIAAHIGYIRSIGKLHFVTSCSNGSLPEAQGLHATWDFTPEEARTPPNLKMMTLYRAI